MQVIPTVTCVRIDQLIKERRMTLLGVPVCILLALLAPAAAQHVTQITSMSPPIVHDEVIQHNMMPG